MRKMALPVSRDSLDRFLVAVAVGAFFCLALVFLGATLYDWRMVTLFPDWEQSYEYEQYVGILNMVAGSLVSVLLVSLLLCLERRSVSLTRGAVAIVLACAGAIVGGIGAGWKGAVTVGMAMIALFQAFLLIELIVTRRARSDKATGVEKAGSLLLHSGYAVFVIAVAPVNGARTQLSVFWAATALIVIGTALSFYGRSIERVALRFAKGRGSSQA